jgi:hypothetical protein
MYAWQHVDLSSSLFHHTTECRPLRIQQLRASQPVRGLSGKDDRTNHYVYGIAYTHTTDSALRQTSCCTGQASPYIQSSTAFSRGKGKGKKKRRNFYLFISLLFSSIELSSFLRIFLRRANQLIVLCTERSSFLLFDPSRLVWRFAAAGSLNWQQPSEQSTR